MNISTHSIQLLEKVSDAVIVINRDIQQVVYFNPACRWLLSTYEGMSVEALADALECGQPMETAKALTVETLQKQSEYVFHDIQLKSATYGICHCDVRVGFLEGSQTELYLIFGYDRNEIEANYNKNRCYDTIYRHSFSYPFCLNVKTREIRFIGPKLDSFKVHQVMQNYPQEVLEAGILHQDDVDKFLRLVDRMYRGEEPVDQFRAYNEKGAVLWYKVRYTVHRNHLDEPIEVVGEFINNQEEKFLERKLTTDGLTKCLTKTAFQESVEKVLVEHTGNHAMVIIDVDNFKTINDRLGHQFGDVVLREIGKNLREIFRSSDYVGRIGGDEFMVFLPEMADMEILSKRLDTLIKTMNKSYQGKSRTYSISASVGVSFSPDHGQDFKTLYERADTALYETKNKGKNGYTVYNETMSAGTMRNTTPFHVASRALSQHFDHDLAKEVFSLLFESQEFDLALSTVLKLLGNRYGSDRCYIFEFDDNRLFSNTYEWCKEGISAQKDNLQNQSEEEYAPFIAMANEDGVIYCNNMREFAEGAVEIMENQEIISCLCALVSSGGEYTAMVGFDDCTAPRVWTPNEISTLLYVSKMIAQFLKRKNEVNAIQTTAQDRLAVLDSVNAFVYIVDEENYEIKYFNQNFAEKYPHLAVDDVCYKVLRGREKACDFCPVHAMAAEKSDRFRGVLSSFDETGRVLVNASKVERFAGRPCALFSCSEFENL